MKYVKTPLNSDIINTLKAGDEILLSGTVYTARDIAHKKIIDLIYNNTKLPFNLTNVVIFYTGPTPTPVGKVIGAIGPTSSYRMDEYTPMLLEKGLKGMIGKGPRSKDVIENIKKYKAVYFTAIGGTAALLSKSVKESEIIAFPELGPESIRKIVVENMYLIVAVDSEGNSVY